jgi:geranylgeranyl transferase type-2 subunit alpha
MLQQQQLQLQQDTQAQNDDNTNNDTVLAVWTTEFQLVENAIFTEPDDQTAWWYHRFLLDTAGQAVAHVTATDGASNSDSSINSDWYAALLQQQQSQLQELVSEVADSKWAWLGYLLVLERLHDHHIRDTLQEQADILQQLMILDPDRQARYRHLWNKTQKAQMQNSK